MDAREKHPAEHRDGGGWRLALRVVGWNAALLAVGLALIAAGGELWLRATQPFAESTLPRHFVPGVGYLYAPGAEIRRTNHADFWTVSRANRLGFADREQIDAARAAAGCHVTAIGDSFVAALEVPIAKKFHVRLEALARTELPQFDVTTSAFGRPGFAPVNELAFWDHYARRLRPRLLVLVLALNDLWGNSSLLRSLEAPWDPGRAPFVSVRRTADGALVLLPPDPEPAYRKSRFDRLPAVLRSSYFLRWSRPLIWRLWPQLPAAITDPLEPRQRPAHPEVPPLSEWPATVRAPELPPAFEEALALAAFSLDQFVERTRRDGAALVILATYELGGRDDRAFRRLHALAAARGIPVINQHDYVVSRGGSVREAHWPRDGHWNPAGHRWTAEALLEHLRDNPQICGSSA